MKRAVNCTVAWLLVQLWFFILLVKLPRVAPWWLISWPILAAFRFDRVVACKAGPVFIWRPTL